MKRHVVFVALGLWTLSGLAPGRAAAWDLFRSPNSHVEEGNEALAAGQAELALQAYEKAARELPGRADVHLDRGLALSALGRLDEAREAFDLAARSKAEPKVRSEAYYNLGRTYLEQANAQADAGDIEGAQSQLEESRDALRQALRSQPGFDDAAWNLELVQRRLVELEKERERQKQEQKEQEEQQKQDSQDGEESPQDDQGEQDPSEQGDSEQSDPDSDDGERQDSSPGQDGGAPESPDAGAQEPEGGGQDGGADGGAPPPEPKPDEGPDAGGRPEPEPRDAQNEPPPPGAPRDPGEGEALPQHVQQVLDALQDGEETMQRHQARTRAQQRPRRVKKDW